MLGVDGGAEREIDEIAYEIVQCVEDHDEERIFVSSFKDFIIFGI